MALLGVQLCRPGCRAVNRRRRERAGPLTPGNTGRTPDTSFAPSSPLPDFSTGVTKIDAGRPIPRWRYLNLHCVPPPVPGLCDVNVPV